MGMPFFSIAGVFSSGFFLTRSGEDDGTGEAVAVRMREWASVEGEKEGLYKDEGDVWCTATRVRYKDSCSVHRDTRLTLRRLLYSVLTSGLIQNFYLYSFFLSST
jgi:hypothetical protein